jgi:hypothetical protein
MMAMVVRKMLPKNEETEDDRGKVGSKAKKRQRVTKNKMRLENQRK